LDASYYRQLYINRPDPIPHIYILSVPFALLIHNKLKTAFLPAEVDTTGRVYDDISRSLFLHAHRDASTLTNEIPEESGQFHFLRPTCYADIKGSVGLILTKTSSMRISIPLDLSSRPFIPLPCFICRRRPLPLLAPSLVFTPRRSVLVVHEGFSCLLVVPVFLTPYSFSMTFFLPFGLRLFLFCYK
jgi:hypothetical protein